MTSVAMWKIMIMTVMNDSNTNFIPKPFEPFLRGKILESVKLFFVILKRELEISCHRILHM